MITRRTARIPFGERYRTSRTIFGQAMRLLGRERDLGVFPLLSALLLAVSIGGFGVLAFAYGDAWMESLGVAPPFGLLVLTLLLLPLFYPFAVAGSLFNTAMVFAIHERLAGRRATKRAALQRAWSQLGPLARFNLVGMLVAGILQVVGVLLNKLRLVPYLGQAVQALGFLGWAAASYFVFPILAVERERSALAALRGSAAIARKQWGKTTAGILTLGLAVMVPMVVVSLVLGMAFMAAMTSALDGGPGRLYLFAYLGTTLAVMVGGMAVSQAATTAYQTALYRYAKTRRIPAPFDRATLVDAWKPYRNG